MRLVVWVGRVVDWRVWKLVRRVLRAWERGFGCVVWVGFVKEGLEGDGEVDEVDVDVVVGVKGDAASGSKESRSRWMERERIGAVVWRFC